MSIRVYQLAKQLSLEVKRVIQLLRERGLDVNSPSNSIPSIYADALIEEIGNKGIPTEGISSALTSKQTIQSPENIKNDNHFSVSMEVPVKVEEIPISNVLSTGPKGNTLLESNPGGTKSGDKSKDEYDIGDGEFAIDKNASNGCSDKFRQVKADKRWKRVVIAVGSLDRMKKKDGEPEVRLPELTKKNPPPESKTTEPQENTSVSNFKPFLKKIERQPLRDEILQTIEVKVPLVVRMLATQMNVKPFQLISKLMSMNIFASMNQEIDISVAQNVAEKFGYKLVLAKPEPEKVVKQKLPTRKDVSAEKKGQNFVVRPPVVCIFGHVDHGKTTLLDTIRHAHVAAGEAGGITQHVAAYQIGQNGEKITFIDTPGHAAFSKMRERGANVTDIGILIVAADDGFMPQTDEALKFAQKANIPIIVAINKIDSKGANSERVKQQMQQRNITPEEWGGKTLCVEISALQGTNIENLLELIRLQAEIMDLRSDLSSHVEGIILESKITSRHGATASIIVQNGVLRVGDCVVCGPCYCKVKSLINDCGQQVQEASASTPVDIIGWSAIPEIGSKFIWAENEKVARKQAEEKEIELKKIKDLQKNSKEEIVNLDQLFSAIAAVEEKTLNVILRADVHGSVEALKDILDTIRSKKIKLNILNCDAGSINKNDVILANTSRAQIVAFNVKTESNAQALAKQLGVKIIQHDIIYEIVDKIREAMAECLDPELQEHKLGAAEVRKIFNIKNSIIAGCMTIEGKILKEKFARVIRKKEMIFQGKFSSIKREKDFVNEVRAGFECGIIIVGFDTFETGDIIECFEIIKIQPSL
ncbi:MAG: translation initiation factor IF-2 [Puniceicoccales bacterium]|jgi:translation initiation factor IF-2|nr:translation initiation factor IF-2 [Puniceicoccales bacterium]